MTSETWLPGKSELDSGKRGLKVNDLERGTIGLASKLEEDPRRSNTVPLAQPIVHAATFRLRSVQQYLDMVKQGGFIYSRLGNPSAEAVEVVINNMEGGAGAMVFASGMAAISTALTANLKAGDHVVYQNPLYAGTHRFLSKLVQKWGVEATWVRTGSGVDAFRRAMRPNTKVLYGETPCNPIMSVLDLEAFAKLGKEKNVVTMVDVTMASPYVVRALDFGIDIAIHSATKYMGGHSDCMAGAVSVRSLEMWQNINYYRTTLGNGLSPWDCSLLQRGLKTLHVRMEKHCANAMAVAEWLNKHPKINAVHYPGLKQHPDHAIARRQMRGFGGMIAFEVKGGLYPAANLLKNVRLIEFAVSLGGVESLIEHPASMTHGPSIMTDAERKESLITDGLIRLSTGIEEPEDLIKDLSQALDKVDIHATNASKL